MYLPFITVVGALLLPFLNVLMILLQTISVDSDSTFLVNSNKLFSNCHREGGKEGQRDN